MTNRQLRLASWRTGTQSLISRAAHLAPALGLALASSAQGALSARKKRNDDENQEASREKRDDAGDDSTRKEETERTGGKSDNDQSANGEVKSENQDSNDKAEKRERREDRNEDVADESSPEENRVVSRRQDAKTESADDDAGERSGRRTEELAQNRTRDDEPIDDQIDTGAVPTTPVAPSNPNVSLSDIPDLSTAELVIEANPDVVASVSSSGGFAFARSGNVIAVSGPDGARIIQTDDVEDVVTPSPILDDEPSDDGGNNDMDFLS